MHRLDKGKVTDVDDKLSEMPFLANVGLIMTYKCQIACPHCIIEAGPHRTEEMLLEDAFDWTRQITDYGDKHVKVLSLTGGEPFYNVDDLKAISEFGEACGLFVSAVTNAFWASTEEAAVECLEELGAIKMLSISTDVHHQVHIPFDWVKNAMRAADVCGIPYTVAVCTENEDDEGYKDVMRKLEDVIEADRILTAITFPAGRALKRLGTSGYRMSEEPPVSACSAGSSPIVFPDGRVIACIGPVIDLDSPHPLLLGNLREEPLTEIFDRAQTNPILHAIRVWGPRKLIAMIQEAGLGHYLPDAYIKGSVCNACYSLMSNRRIVAFFDQLTVDPEFRRKVAYARVYYLQENEMAEQLGLGG